MIAMKCQEQSSVTRGLLGREIGRRECRAEIWPRIVGNREIHEFHGSSNSHG